MTHDRGFAMFAIFEHRFLCHAILLTQSLAQQEIGRCTRLASLFMFKLQSLFSTLVAQQWQC